jgi:hypothetical protein
MFMQHYDGNDERAPVDGYPYLKDRVYTMSDSGWLLRLTNAAGERLWPERGVAPENPGPLATELTALQTLYADLTSPSFDHRTIAALAQGRVTDELGLVRFYAPWGPRYQRNLDLADPDIASNWCEYDSRRYIIEEMLRPDLDIESDEGDDDVIYDDHPRGAKDDKYDHHRALFPRMQIRDTLWTRDLACQLLREFDPGHASPVWPEGMDFGTMALAHNPWYPHGGRPRWVVASDVPGDLGLTGRPYRLSLAGDLTALSNGADEAKGRTILSSRVSWSFLPLAIGVSRSPGRKNSYWSLEAMDQTKVLARINELKFGLTSKNTIVAVLGVTSPSRKFHHLDCRMLFPGREKSFNPLAPNNPSGEQRKPRNHCYQDSARICRIEVPRRYNYGACGICFSKFSERQQREWGSRIPATDSLYQAWLQMNALLMNKI